MIISLDKYKNKGSGGGSGGGKFVVGDTTKFPTSTWSSIPDNLDFSQTTDFTSMFQQCGNLTEGLRLGDWSKVTSCAGMYYNCPSLTWAEDMSNSYNCVDFIRMFTSTQLTSAPYIDTQNAARVAFMFNGCLNLQEINLSSTANIKTADGFNQFCYYCPNLTTINGLDFSGISMATAEPIAVFGEGSGALGPVIFGNNDSLTDITISGSISFSWNHQYGPSALTNLSNKSIISFLTAMSKCNNPEEAKTMRFNCKYEYGSEVPQLIEDCTNKNWSISGLTLGVPHVIIDNVPTDVEIGKDFEVNYHVTTETERFFGLTSTLLRVYDGHGYIKDFVLDSLSGVIVLNDSDLQDARFITIVIYNGSGYEGGEYSYNRVDNGGSEPEIDTLWGNPDEAIPVSFAEFATKPNANYGENPQWYELTGILYSAPQVETGTWILTDPEEELEQSFTVDGNEYNNAIVVNYTSQDLTNDISNEWDFNNFPGDGALVTIRTLKHYGIPSNLGVDSDIHYAGKNSNSNSPLAIFVGSEGGVAKPEMKFWVDGDVNAGEEFDLNYELYNRKNLTEDPTVDLYYGEQEEYAGSWTIKDDEGVLSITDSTKYNPLIGIFVNGDWYTNVEYTRVSGDDTQAVELNVTSHSCTESGDTYRDMTFNCEDGKSVGISFMANPIVEGTYMFDDKTLAPDFSYYDNVKMTECTAIVTGALFPGNLNIDVTFKRQDDDTTYHFTYQNNLNE